MTRPGNPSLVRAAGELVAAAVIVGTVEPDTESGTSPTAGFCPLGSDLGAAPRTRKHTTQFRITPSMEPATLGRSALVHVVSCGRTSCHASGSERRTSHQPA